MPDRICKKCGSKMIVRRANMMDRVPSLTVRCVTCGMEETIAIEPKDWRRAGAV